MTINIDGYDKTKYVDWNSLQIQNILTSEVDTCSFVVKSYGSHQYIPKIAKEIIITDGGNRIFAGHIVNITQQAQSYKVIKYECECIDYTRLLQKKLVSDTFEDQTIAQIIETLITTYCDGYGLTTTNVDCDIEIERIAFDYISVQQCLERLADIVNYNWWVDYNKNIYFKSSGVVSAPFGITDTNGKYVFNSLIRRKDDSQIKNSIIVRGGYYYGTLIKGHTECDGVKHQFRTPYKFKNIGASLTGQVLDVGIDFSGNADDYDALYNFQEKTLKFKEADKPSAGSTLSFSGNPRIPVIIKIKDQAAVNAMLSAEGETVGDYEYIIVDRSLKSKSEARDRAEAELVAYANTLEEGSFETETSGLQAGQSIYVDSDAHGIDESFLIRQVTSTMMTPTQMRYKISLVSTKTIDMIGLLQKLLLGQSQSFDEDEIIDKINSYFEGIVLGEVYSTSTEHNPQDETITLASTFSANIDYPAEFVVGPYSPPTGSKRIFLCTMTADGGGARLG